MMTLKQAIRHANKMMAGQRVQWIVGMTPANAPCNQAPANTFNEGRWVAIRGDERADYAAGGMTFPTPMPRALHTTHQDS